MKCFVYVVVVPDDALCFQAVAFNSMGWTQIGSNEAVDVDRAIDRMDRVKRLADSDDASAGERSA